MSETPSVEKDTVTIKQCGWCARHGHTTDEHNAVCPDDLTCADYPDNCHSAEKGLGRSHPKCWTGTEYRHTCHEPSGRPCVDCGKPAGTPWGPMWCPECDVIRLDRVSGQLAALRVTSPAGGDTNE